MAQKKTRSLNIYFNTFLNVLWYIEENIIVKDVIWKIFFKKRYQYHFYFGKKETYYPVTHFNKNAIHGTIKCLMLINYQIKTKN